MPFDNEFQPHMYCFSPSFNSWSAAALKSWWHLIYLSYQQRTCTLHRWQYTGKFSIAQPHDTPRGYHARNAMNKLKTINEGVEGEICGLKRTSEALLLLCGSLCLPLTLQLCFIVKSSTLRILQGKRHLKINWNQTSISGSYAYYKGL